jgi:hypothetical protein
MSTAPLIQAPGAAPRRTRPTLQGLAAVVLAGSVAGLVVGGLGSRVAMRIAALAAGDPAQGRITEAGATVGRITAEGTLFLIVFAGIGATLIGTAFYLVTRPWLPARRRVRTVTFGILELLVFGSVLVDASNPDFTILGHPLLNVTLFGSLFVLHGSALVMLIRPSRRVLARLSGAPWGARLVDIGAVLGLGFVAFGVVAIGARSGGSDRLEWVALAICALGITVIGPRRARPITIPTLRFVGAIALALLALGGAWAVLDSVTTIV